MLLASSYAIQKFTLRHVIRPLTRPVTSKWLSQALRSNMSSKVKNGVSAASQSKVITTEDGQEFTEVREGLAKILIPPPPKGKDAKAAEEQQQVFYNPIQQFNRDLTVLAIKAYGEDVVARKQAHMAKRHNKNNKRKRDKSDVVDDRPKKQHDAPSALSGNVDPGLGTDATNLNGEDTAMPDAEKAQKKSVANDEPESVTTADPDAQASRNGDSREETKPIESGHERKLSPPKFTILDALSATGLRALRYAQELPFVTSISSNDLTPSAVEAIKRNVEHNGVGCKVVVKQGDARAHMYSLLTEALPEEPETSKGLKRGGPKPPNNHYDVIDLDPYGTAAIFFDAAINAIRDDGGLLCVTCTDSGVWASHGYSEKSFALYGGIPVKGFHSHEAGIRLILHGLATTAARQGLAIEPLLSLSIDYYIRIFVKVKKSPASVKFLAGKTMIVYDCDHGCGAYETQLLLRNKKVANKSGKGSFYKHTLSAAPRVDRSCKHCGSLMHLAGPMYAGPLHSPDFINKILNELPNASRDIYGTIPRIEGMLQTALEETLEPPADDQPSIKEDELASLEPYPFFFHPTILARAMHCVCPDEDSFRGALRGLGYQVTRSHCKPGSIKTDAPWSVLWNIMREWVRQKNPVKVENISPNTPAYRLLRLGAKPGSGPKINAEGDAEDDAEPDGETDEHADKGNEVDKLEVVFDKTLGRDTSKKGLVRYQANPRENWGPLSRASG